MTNRLSFDSKGQLISECLYNALNFPKKPTKIWQTSALEYKKWSNEQNKGMYFPIMI